MVIQIPKLIFEKLIVYIQSQIRAWGTEDWTGLSKAYPHPKSPTQRNTDAESSKWTKLVDSSVGKCARAGNFGAVLADGATIRARR